MTEDEKKALQKARRRHARKARIEIMGYDKHPDENTQQNPPESGEVDSH